MNTKPTAASGTAADPDTAAVAAMELDRISHRFGKFSALTSVSLAVMTGRITAVIGPNGAGKSTMAGVISGNLTPNEGTVRLQGRDVTSMQPWRRARLGLGRSYQVASVFDSLSVRGNLEVAWRFRSRRIAAPGFDEGIRLAGLEGVIHQQARDLSEGDRKRLEIGMLVMQGAHLLVLDEPTAGMSAAESSAIAELILGLKRAGSTILIIEHDMNVVFKIADRVIVLHQGEVLFEGHPREVLASEVVRDVYLGTADIEQLRDMTVPVAMTSPGAIRQ